MPRKIKGYGWLPDLPDGRDLLYGAPVEAVAKLPKKVDMRKQCPPVYDQGSSAAAPRTRSAPHWSSTR